MSHTLPGNARRSVVAFSEFLADDCARNLVRAMHKIIGVILLVFGAFLLLQAHDMSRSFISHVTLGSMAAKVRYYYLGGALCCAVGLVEFFRSDKK